MKGAPFRTAALYARRLRTEFLETTTAVFQAEMNRGHVARVEAAVEQEALVRVTRLGLVAVRLQFGDESIAMHDVDERESTAIAQTDQHPAEMGGPGCCSA